MKVISPIFCCHCLERSLRYIFTLLFFSLSHYLILTHAFKYHVMVLCLLNLHWALLSLVAQMVKHLPTMWETQVQSPGQEDLLEKKMATHSSILAWKIPWTDEPCRLQSMGRKELDMTELLHFIHFISTLIVSFFLIYCFQHIFFTKMY